MSSLKIAQQGTPATGRRGTQQANLVCMNVKRKLTEHIDCYALTSSNQSDDLLCAVVGFSRAELLVVAAAAAALTTRRKSTLSSPS